MFDEILDAFAGKRVLVIGDVMLDEYITGEVRRISPEAPIPVVETRGHEYRPGGASNVAVNIATLGGVPLLCGVVGDDDMADKLALVLQPVDSSGEMALVHSKDRPTTVKTRIVAHGQQMLRLDTESQQPIPELIEERIISWFRGECARADACVLSDYAKGVLTPRLCRTLITMARAANLPVIVDPKGRQYDRYSGATVITPNKREAALAANVAADRPYDVDVVAIKLLDELGGANLLVTRSEEGMSLYRAGHAPLHIPTHALKVYDVTGAGDTVVGALALGLAAGAALPVAAHLANVAAGVVVGQLGAASLTREELRTSVVRSGVVAGI